MPLNVDQCLEDEVETAASSEILEAYMDASLHQVMQQFIEVVAENAYGLRSEG